MDIEKFLEAKKELEEYIEVQGKKLGLDFFDKFFKEFPMVEWVRWNQYTPGFNDGEPCVNGMDSVAIKVQGVYDLPHEETDSYGTTRYVEEDDCDYSELLSMSYRADKNIAKEHGQEVAEDLKKASAVIGQLEDVWERLFGTDMSIKFSKSEDGTLDIDTTNYDCGF